MFIVRHNCLSQHMQRNKSQHQLLLAITERLSLPKVNEKTFALLERHERAVHGQRRSVKTIKEIRREKSELHQQRMSAVRNMPEERSSHANIMERTDHREVLRFISTVELPYLHNELLNNTVDDEHKRREEVENRNSRHDQIFEGRIHSPDHDWTFQEIKLEMSSTYGRCSRKYWNAYC